MSIAEYFSSMDYGPAPEDDKAARAWLAEHHARFDHFIDGAWSPASDAASFDTEEPANGRTLARIAQGSTADVDRAVKAALAALSEAAEGNTDNLMHNLIDCANAYCTVGEMVSALKAVWGEFQQPVVF